VSNGLLLALVELRLGLAKRVEYALGEKALFRWQVMRLVRMDDTRRLVEGDFHFLVVHQITNGQLLPLGAWPQNGV